MKIAKKHSEAARSAKGFTLAEVVMAIVILAIGVQGILLGYVRFAQQAEWTAHSLAAQSLAAQAVEQARSAKWDTQAWPQSVGTGTSDELGVTSYTQVNTLDVPNNGSPTEVTNFVSITTVSISPPVRQIRSDCVWRFMSRGFFTNTVVTLRAPDQ